MGVEELKKVNYMEKMGSLKFSKEFRSNMMSLMEIGFLDFDKNLRLLNQNLNNIDVVCAKLLEEQM